MPSTMDFREEIEKQIGRARKQGRPHVEINSGELHRTLGGYPPKTGTSHSMPKCCSAMRDMCRAGKDEIIFEADSGQSASLTIRYIV